MGLLYLGNLSHKFYTIATIQNSQQAYTCNGRDILSKAKMYPTSPVSPVMLDTSTERSAGVNLSVDDNEQQRLYDIKTRASPTSSRIKSPTTETIDTRNEYKTHSSSSLSSRKRKQSPGSKSDTEVPKRSKTFPLYPNSVKQMNLDINDIGMPGRSGSTRSRTKVPVQERRRVPVA